MENISSISENWKRKRKRKKTGRLTSSLDKRKKAGKNRQHRCMYVCNSNKNLKISVYVRAASSVSIYLSLSVSIPSGGLVQHGMKTCAS